MHIRMIVIEKGNYSSVVTDIYCELFTCCVAVPFAAVHSILVFVCDCLL